MFVVSNTLSLLQIFYKKSFFVSETCNVANSVLRSSWADYLPLIAKNPKSTTPDGFLPSVLANLLKRCSGLCIGLDIKGNASINYLKDGQGKTARKTNLNELYATMSTDTDIIFPVFKPSYPNEDYRFIEVIQLYCLGPFHMSIVCPVSRATVPAKSPGTLA